ncbi:MAG: hypothetical protein ACKPEN_20400 [Planktothrix sp.]|uniref:hypothetical protein n=1 Tax=Planktothrix sp. TaxID=3088171 RepID=UPI0038D3843D
MVQVLKTNVAAAPLQDALGRISIRSAYWSCKDWTVLAWWIHDEIKGYLDVFRTIFNIL